MGTIWSLNTNLVNVRCQACHRRHMTYFRYMTHRCLVTRAHDKWTSVSVLIPVETAGVTPKSEIFPDGASLMEFWGFRLPRLLACRQEIVREEIVQEKVD